MSVVYQGEVDCPMRYKDFDVKWQMSISVAPLQNMKSVIGEEKLKEAIRRGCKDFTNKDGSIHIAPNVFIYTVAKP